MERIFYQHSLDLVKCLVNFWSNVKVVEEHFTPGIVIGATSAVVISVKIVRMAVDVRRNILILIGNGKGYNK